MGSLNPFGSVSATQQNGNQSTQIDPVLKDFINNFVIGNYKDLTSGVLTGDKSFIAPQSDLTKSFYDAVSGLDSTNPNSGFASDFLKAAINGEHQTSYTPALAEATGYTPTLTSPLQKTSVGQGASYSQPYFDPYTKDVVGGALDAYDTGVGQGLQTLRASRDAGSSFGDRSYLAESKYLSDAAKGRSAVAAPLLSQGFQFASTQGQSDADRSAQAAIQDAILQATATENNANRLTSAAAALAADKNNVSLANAGATNNAAQFNVTTGLNDLFTRAGLTTNLNNIDTTNFSQLLQKIGLMGSAGSSADAYDQTKASEPLDLLFKAASIAGGVPYGTTQQSKQTGKGATFGYGGK